MKVRSSSFHFKVHKVTTIAYFIVPIDLALAKAAVAPYSLLPIPANDRTLFNSPFPTGKHPLLVSTGLQEDIRMLVLQIPTPLFSGSLIFPYVDRLGDGQTPFTFSVKSYIGGFDGDSDSAYIPGKGSKPSLGLHNLEYLAYNSVCQPSWALWRVPRSRLQVSCQTILPMKRSAPRQPNTSPKSKMS